jgi:hypothetical protein
VKPTHWTYSRLSDYEKCPALYAGRYLNKWPGFVVPPHPALERGNKMHALMEDRVGGGKKLSGALARYDNYVEDLLCTYTHREVELPLGFDAKWQPVAWKDPGIWLRMKMDFFGMVGAKAKVVDWKTGGIYGSNADQVRLYAGATFERFPRVKTVEVELVYLDQKQGIAETIARADWKAKRAEFTQRAQAMLTASSYPQNPGTHCGYCSFSIEKGGPCPGRGAARDGLQTDSTRARLVVAQAAPLRGRHAGSGVAAPAALVEPTGGAKARRRKA